MNVFFIVADKQTESKNIIKVDTKAVSINTYTPESPNTPTQVTLSKAPTPWLQNKNKPQEELPEWAKRACINKAIGGDPSESALSPTAYVQVQQSPSQYSETKQKQEQEQEQYPIPQCNQQLKSQQLSRQSQQQKQNVVSAMPQQINPQSHQHERVIPVRVS